MKITKLSIALFVATISSHVLADTVEVPIRPSFTPEKAVGLLFSGQGVLERTPAYIKSDGESFIVSFDVSAEEKSAGISASAVVTAQDGEQRAFGDVVRLSPSTPKTSSISIPPCASNSGSIDIPSFGQKGGENDVGSLLGIKDVRLKNRDSARASLKDALSGDAAAKLTKLEVGLGLSKNGDAPLSWDLPASELANRLSAIQLALSTYMKTQGKISN